MDISVIYKQKDKDWVYTIPKPSDEKQNGEGRECQERQPEALGRGDNLKFCGQNLLNALKIALFPQTLWQQTDNQEQIRACLL